MLSFRAALPPHNAQSFSPSVSRLAARQLETATATPPQPPVLKALEADSGFGGLTLGEGLQQYRQLCRISRSDVGFLLAVSILLPVFSVMETVCLPMWLSPAKRRSLLAEEGIRYPYHCTQRVLMLPKEMLANQLTAADDVFARLKKLPQVLGHLQGSRECFDQMVDRWVELGVVSKRKHPGREQLLITRKGYDALKQYDKAHPQAGGPM